MGTRRETRDALAAAGLRPHRRWGQNFLCDRGVAHRIVELACPEDAAGVLEVGPGLGALTDELAARARRLVLVEIDRGLAARLEERYADDPRIAVIVGDVRELPLAELVAAPATVVGNLPYNVATPILFRLLDVRAHFPHAVVMLQREMALRLAAGPGTDAYGVTSVILQAFGEVRVAFGVSRRSFLPSPDVDSAVVDIRWSAQPRVDVGADEAHFRAVVRAAFGKRRKMLRNALADLGRRPAALEAAFAAARVDPRARAETLDLAAFGRLARALAA
ncbi:MAG TPA: 16S rRNA (adenine(1518)-N(6)/adenine(1519)-N(6))-dimethyltransferase RsmA [Candidatus Binatia bacterium]|jgi:16S rRNA (adenine1518-N6/adenine1519-N6)-dimethyltransferase|nr:16S rRNA (adenine(1518)-N(6)/adenine(1519)-N(6))-dimethyltransferase RsmA [Candidatus Binatia bacterium]